MSALVFKGISKLPNPKVTPVYKNQAFLRALADVENGQRIGYQVEVNQWVPHKSIEGGTATIGYGHKLSPVENQNNYVVIDGQKIKFNYNKGIGPTDEQIEILFNSDVRKAYAKALQEWNTHLNVGETKFEQLATKYQGILTDLVFNIGTLATGGTWDWPKLKQAILKQDDPAVREQSLRFYFDGFGRKIPLLRRTQMIANALGLGIEKSDPLLSEEINESGVLNGTGV